MFSMTIADSPRLIGDTGEISPSDVRRVEDFILRNKGLLLSYWNLEDGYIGTKQVIDALEHVT